jgi:hypothetical protein
MQNFNPQPPQPPPQRQLPHQRIWPWFRHLSKRAKVIGFAMLILVLSLCVCVSVAATTTPTPTVAIPTAAPTPTQKVAAITAKIDATATQDAQNYQATATAAPTDTPTHAPTATPTPSPQPTAKPTPKPTQRPIPTPTPKRCVAVNNNPWCYNFSPGGLIYTPPSGFCGYFNCIATFYASDDPGDGYIIECADSTFSQSGGESGACSHHGGVMRPLYSH